MTAKKTKSSNFFMFMNQSRKILRAKGKDNVVNGKPSFAFTRLSLWRRRVAMAGKVVNENLWA